MTFLDLVQKHIENLRMNLVVGIFLGFHSLSFAVQSLPQKNVHCADKVGLDLQGNLPQAWLRAVDLGPEIRVYRSPSQKFGTWYEIHIGKERTRLLAISEGSVESHVWEKDCQVSKSKGKWIGGGSLANDAKHFRDEDLKELLDSEKGGLIYVWTPGMVYSGKHLKSFESAARTRNLNFVPVLTANSTIAAAREVAGYHGFELNPRKLFSVELLMRTVSTHFPQAWIYKNRKLAAQPLVGIFDENSLTRHIDRIIEDLK